ncbi:MAG: protein-export chaperone SecB [Thiotrichales bacterium]|nr:MAG: protein-export chaperone SecB [Thiotrichales bacterium]
MAEENQAAQGQPEGQAQDQQFSIQKLYLKDVSFESPNTPAVFADGEWQPEVNIQLNSTNQSIGQDTFEVDLKLTVTAKQNKKTAFLVELTQSGIFTIAGFDAENLRGMLGAFCPETLFPFAREAIAELVSKGGFPPLLLAPVNFNALYMQQAQQQQTATASQDTAH